MKMLIFTKDSCGPCGLVKRYFRAMGNPLTEEIQEVELEDFSDDPIPPENLDLAKKYGVTATPVLVITEDDGEMIAKYVGGTKITQNIRQVFARYV